MAKKELSGRNVWQDYAGDNAKEAEVNVYNIFINAFKNTEYVLHKQPKHLKNLYTKVTLSDRILSEIYNPKDLNLSDKKWGVSPDFAIENTKTGKILFGEIKRQDGWVEGKNPSAGRGNAHERSCKLFAPGLIKAYRKIGKIDSEEILPFFVVFVGDITRDPKRVREIAFWYDKYDKNYFMLRPGKTGDDLIAHFNRYLKRFLN